MRADQLTDVVTEHGEGPASSERWNGVRWVDMMAGDVCELQPDGSVDRVHVGTVAAMLRPRRHAGWVVADEHGLLITDSDELHAPLRRLAGLTDDPEVRMNEGGCDPAGNLYLGSMAYDSRPHGGSLYLIGTDGGARTVSDQVSVSNGIDWSPDDRTCYYVDSPTHRIERFDWSADADLGHPSRFVALNDDLAAEAVYDGLTVDDDGNVWVALFGGGRVHCYAPDGTLREQVEVAARQVTAVRFAGPDLEELIITTSREGLGTDAEPAAGALFSIRPGVRGQPLRPFGG